LILKSEIDILCVVLNFRFQISDFKFKFYLMEMSYGYL